MTSSGKKGKAAVLEFDTQSKGQFYFVLCRNDAARGGEYWKRI